MDNPLPFIISVGNIAMGGTGKTPFTIFLTQHYLAKGDRVAILSLGYKGGLGYDVNVISDGVEIFHTPPMAADEPYMMAKTLLSQKDSDGSGAIVITGKRRIDSYNIAMEKYSPTVFILDDAFQHRKMPRHLNIVLLDYNNPFSTGFPVPFGYLREFPSAIKRADIIVFTRSPRAVIPDKAIKYCKKYCEGKPIFFSNINFQSLVTPQGTVAVNSVCGQKVWLMSAIANHDQFQQSVQSNGLSVVGRSTFSDHHQFTNKEIDGVITAANASGCDLILTTEKDMVKIPAIFKDKFSYPILGIDILGDSRLFWETVGKYRN